VVFDIYICLLLCFSVSQKLVKQDGEFVVVKIDNHCREVTTQTPMKFLELGLQKRERKYY